MGELGQEPVEVIGQLVGDSLPLLLGDRLTQGGEHQVGRLLYLRRADLTAQALGDAGTSDRVSSVARVA